jgi:hypothetical protein
LRDVYQEANSVSRHPTLLERRDRTDDPISLTRRAWLAGAMLGFGATSVAPAARAGEAGGDPDEASEIASVQASARKAGLGPFALNRTKHFLCLGNGPDKFRAAALGICESLAQALIPYFNERGFKLAFPPRSPTVIALKDSASYKAYIGEDPGEVVGGHFDLDTNRLVIFDFRPDQSEAWNNPERINLLTLVHETTHLLCFNTGLLSLKADVPACISEGLATYVELWRPRGRGKIGTTNGPRLKALVAARENGEPWIPIADLLANDDLFREEKSAQLAYVESWLLVHYLIKTPAQLTNLKAYLAKIPAAAGAAKRVEYAEASLGSLQALDHEVSRHGQRLMR